jgi:hypothetical protein
MADNDRKLLALFEEYHQTQRSAHEATGMIDFHSRPTEDQMAGEDGQEALEYLQAFASVHEERSKSRSDNEEFEGSTNDDAEGEADDEQTKGNDSRFLQEEDA